MSKGRAARVDPAAVIREGALLQNSGRSGDAVALMRAHLRGNESNAEYVLALGAAEVQARFAGFGTEHDAVTHLTSAVRLRRADPRGHYWLGVALRGVGRMDDAVRALTTALEMRSGWPDARGALAEAMLAKGDADAALAASADASTPMLRWCRGEALARTGQTDEALALLRQVAADTSAPAQLRQSAWFSLATIHDKAGNEDALFDAARQGHSFQTLHFDAAVFRAASDRTRATFTRASMASLPTSGVRTERPLFIVGMPRSGTSLMEQILDMHPDVAGGGELSTLSNAVRAMNGSVNPSDPFLRDDASLTPGALRREANTIVSRLKSVDAKARYVTDKTPLHALHLGAAQLLLPGARIIAMQRDLRDVGLSYHTRLLIGMHPQAARLADIGAVCAVERAIVAHWRDVLDLPILDVRYEDLVTDNEAQVRRVLDFLELPFDDACLRSHETSRTTITASADQVRKPVYSSSIGRWKRYERSLAPLIEAIGDIDD
ncbi:MAG: sulfotransferase [Planctomycetota bacterium]